MSLAWLGRGSNVQMINSLVQVPPGDAVAHLSPASSSEPLPLSSSCLGRQVLLVSEEQHGDTMAREALAAGIEWKSRRLCFSICGSPAEGSCLTIGPVPVCARLTVKMREPG